MRDENRSKWKRKCRKNETLSGDAEMTAARPLHKSDMTNLMETLKIDYSLAVERGKNKNANSIQVLMMKKYQRYQKWHYTRHD